MKKLLTILTSLLITACTHNQHLMSEEQAYISLLAKEVENSDSIIFAEHSYKFDFLKAGSYTTENFDKAPVYTYQTQEITAGQQKTLYPP